MAMLCTSLGFGQRCLRSSWGNLSLLTSSRAFSTTHVTECRKPAAADKGHRPGPHFRSKIQHHPLYTDLPKREQPAAEVAQVEKAQSPPAVKQNTYEEYTMAHLIWGKNEAEDVVVTHHDPRDKADKLAMYTVKVMRFFFDLFSGYHFGAMNEIKWLRRIIFLETVAGVPGMMGAMARHLQSLRRLERDHGWIHTLLEEAENERMHLLTALELRKPGPVFRFSVLMAQGLFTNIFFLAYLISPRFCHRFVGYLEEDAVKTYTRCLAEIDSGHLKMWSKMPAPPIAIEYWRLGENALMRDVILAIRADEAHHRLVNHTLGGMDPNQKNPFGPGQ